MRKHPLNKILFFLPAGQTPLPLYPLEQEELLWRSEHQSRALWGWRSRKSIWRLRLSQDASHVSSSCCNYYDIFVQLQSYFWASFETYLSSDVSGISGIYWALRCFIVLIDFLLKLFWSFPRNEISFTTFAIYADLVSLQTKADRYHMQFKKRTDCLILSD